MPQQNPFQAKRANRTAQCKSQKSSGATSRAKPDGIFFALTRDFKAVYKINDIAALLEGGASLTSNDKGRNAVFACLTSEIRSDKFCRKVLALIKKSCPQKMKEMALARDEYGWTPLHHAAKWNKGRCLEFILELVDDDGQPLLPVDTLDGVAGAGMTALHRACNWRSSRAIRVLLDHGADPNYRNLKNYTTPFEVAVWSSLHEQEELSIECLKMVAPHVTDMPRLMNRIAVKVPLQLHWLAYCIDIEKVRTMNGNNLLHLCYCISEPVARAASVKLVMEKCPGAQHIKNKLNLLPAEMKPEHLQQQLNNLHKKQSSDSKRQGSKGSKGSDAKSSSKSAPHKPKLLVATKPPWASCANVSTSASSASATQSPSPSESSPSPSSAEPKLATPDSRKDSSTSPALSSASADEQDSPCSASPVASPDETCSSPPQEGAGFSANPLPSSAAPSLQSNSESSASTCSTPSTQQQACGPPLSALSFQAFPSAVFAPGCIGYPAFPSAQQALLTSLASLSIPAAGLGLIQYPLSPLYLQHQRQQTPLQGAIPSGTLPQSFFSLPPPAQTYGDSSRGLGASALPALPVAQAPAIPAGPHYALPLLPGLFGSGLGQLSPFLGAQQTGVQAQAGCAAAPCNGLPGGAMRMRAGLSGEQEPLSVYPSLGGSVVGSSCACAEDGADCRAEGAVQVDGGREGNSQAAGVASSFSKLRIAPPGPRTCLEAMQSSSSAAIGQRQMSPLLLSAPATAVAVPSRPGQPAGRSATEFCRQSNNVQVGRAF